MYSFSLWERAWKAGEHVSWAKGCSRGMCQCEWDMVNVVNSREGRSSILFYLLSFNLKGGKEIEEIINFI